jgi:hypothetical protein
VEQVVFDEVSSDDFVKALPDIKRLGIDVVCFQCITSLVFECNKPRHKASYPLLSMVSISRPQGKDLS